MEAKLRKHLERLLSRDAAGRSTPRLLDDAKRLMKRIDSLIAMSLTRKPVDRELLELAAHALQLPMRQTDDLPVGKFGQLNLRTLAERSASLLVELAGELIEESDLDRVAQLLLDMPTKSPDTDDARLLADAINLDDFGLAGLLNATILAALQGQGIDTLLDGAAKRDTYGYWSARLRDGFHFPPVRAIAEKRLAHLRQTLADIERD